MAQVIISLFSGARPARCPYRAAQAAQKLSLRGQFRLAPAANPVTLIKCVAALKTEDHGCPFDTASQGNYSFVQLMLTRLSSFLMVGVAAAALCASAQELLYEETFPYAGPPGGVLPVTTAGWANDITGNPNRLFQESGSNGAVFAFQGTMDVPISTAFYTTTALDTGGTGPQFPSIDPDRYFCVILSADIRAGFDADNIEARFAVQMNGSTWLAAATPLPVPGMHTPFRTYSQNFDTNGWNALTLNGTSVTIGGAATAEGTITGAGLVFTHSLDNGTFDFDNFRIIANRGEVSIARSKTPEGDPVAVVSWVGVPGARLQSSPTPQGDWEDVPGTFGKSSAILPMTSAQIFFRLAKDI